MNFQQLRIWLLSHVRSLVRMSLSFFRTQNRELLQRRKSRSLSGISAGVSLYFNFYRLSFCRHPLTKNCTKVDVEFSRDPPTGAVRY